MEELKAMKVEKTRREPFWESHKEITFPNRKRKGDAFDREKKSWSNPQIWILDKECKLLSYTRLTLIVKKVLFNETRNPDLTRMKPIKNSLKGKNKSKYCRFHRDHGHLTGKCFELKKEIKALIRRNKLKIT